MQPNNAETNNNLGNTCKRLGRLHLAEQYWLRALALRPGYAEPHSNLANLLTTQGLYDQAARHARQAIELKPQLPDAYINLAATENTRERYAEALRHLNALLTFAPLHANGLASRAQTLKQLGRLDEGLDAARRAVTAAPHHAESHIAHGSLLQALGRSDEALLAFERAASLPSPAAEQALINIALLFMECGQPEKAEAAFLRALSAYPSSASAWFNMVDLKKFSPGDPAIEAMQALLASKDENARFDRTLLHFALGKAYLDAGESELAFTHLNQGNKAKRATITYDAAATSRWISSIADTFTKEMLDLADRASSIDPSGPQPIFVLGMPRSGTTLVEQILSSHPEIYGAGELNHIQNFVTSLGDFPASAGKLTPEHLDRLGETYRAAIAKHGPSQRYVVDKMPANFLYAGLIRLILPNARIIHCRRNPVDTCLSCYTKLFTNEQHFTYDLAELGQFHKSYEHLTAPWRDVLPASHFLEVDYEAVVEGLEGEIRRLLAFLDLPWDPACLSFHENQRAVRTASVNQVRKPIYRSSAGRWRKHAQQLGPLLDTLGIEAATPQDNASSPTPKQPASRVRPTNES